MFSVTISAEPGRAVLTLMGEFDLACKEAFEEAFRSLPYSQPEVAIDLRQLTYLDSSGLGCLIDAQRRLAGRGIRLTLVRGGGIVDRVFGYAGLETAFRFEEEEPPSAG